jgi:protein-tyrosine phosphatase
MLFVFDLHNHILPGIDDGAASLDVALQMARQWEDDGVSVVACTPHILPGVYANSGQQILLATEALQIALALKGSPLKLVAGADNHIVPDFVSGLRSGHLLSIGKSRYVLVEPPHHVCPPRIEQFFFDILVAGYVPILTHPERLSWVEGNYQIIRSLARRGVWMQLTAGSLDGQFGRRARHLAERMLDDGLVHILASDAHGSEMRKPCLRRGYEIVSHRLGEDEAAHLVTTRPQGILNDTPPENLPRPLYLSAHGGLSDATKAQVSENSTNARLPNDLPLRSSNGIVSRLRRVFK